MKRYLADYVKLLRFARPYVWALVLAALCMGVSTLFEGVTFSSLAPILDRVFAQKEIVIPGEVPGFVDTIVSRLNAIEPLVFVKYLFIT